MRFADHQPQWAELEAAGGISAKPRAAIRRRVGAARRSAGAAGAALLRRQQGTVVRDHRRFAAISGISAGSVAHAVLAPAVNFNLGEFALTASQPRSR